MSAPAIDAARVIADLRALADLTSDERGAQRVCWTKTWREARAFLTDRLDELGIEPELDAAGNLWATVPGADRTAPAVTVGSHVDSVPDGGWLDGAYGVMAALGVLRAWTESGQAPSRDLQLVDWADEEGARFGRSLFGSSAFAGSLDVAEVRSLTDAEGNAIADVLAENGVELARVGEATARQEGIGAYLELHIEQGPVLEGEGLTAAAVTGTAGVERLRFVFGGQASHAGTTPMGMRRDAGLAAAAAALAISRIPDAEGGVATTGELVLRPGIVTAVAGEAVLACDLRHPDAEPLARMLAAARDAANTAAADHGCAVAERPVWRIEPIAFDPELVAAARAAVAETTGTDRAFASGALHDAAEVARVRPAAMIFCASTGGISHAAQEDSPQPALKDGIEAFGRLAVSALR
jgi:hydantoinase/carbamoylase family amidase